MLSKLPHTLLYFSFLVAAFSPFPPESSHQCFFIDGSFDHAGGPCYGNVGASMCCYTGENCQPNSALCLTSPNGPVGPYDNGSSIWRRSCTDVTWQDAACLAIAYGKSPYYSELVYLRMSQDQRLTALYVSRCRRRIRAAKHLFGWNGLPAD